MSELYTKGFNEGYIITMHLPDLARGLSKIESDVPWAEGFRDGRRECLLEKVKELRPEWLKSDWGRDQGPAPDKTQDRERGFDVER